MFIMLQDARIGSCDSSVSKGVDRFDTASPTSGCVYKTALVRCCPSGEAEKRTEQPDFLSDEAGKSLGTSLRCRRHACCLAVKKKVTQFQLPSYGTTAAVRFLQSCVSEDFCKTTRHDIVFAALLPIKDKQ